MRWGSSVHTAIARCRAAALGLLVLFGSIQAAGAEITVIIDAPSPGRLTGPLLAVSARVVSTLPVTAVDASAAGRFAPLTFGAGAWAGTLDLSGVARGPYTLTVVAQDGDGLRRSAQVEFVLDAPPQVVVTSPTPYTLARPDFRLIASCVDDGPDCLLRAIQGSEELGSAVGALDLVVASRVTGVTSFQVVARDSAGQQASRVVPLYVNVSPFLALVSSFSGTILAVDATRALVRDERTTPTRLVLVDRATGAEEVVYTATSEPVAEGYLTPLGALFTTLDLAGQRVLRERRDDTLLDHGPLWGTDVRVAGSWALWTRYNAPSGSSLRLYDLQGGTMTVVADASGDFGPPDLGANGDVVYRTPDLPGQVWRYRSSDASYALLANDTTASYERPKTDGILVVATKVMAGAGPRLVLLEPGGEVVLTDLTSTYLVGEGRVAFARTGPGGSAEIWVRSADGAESRAMALGILPRLEAMSPAGEVVAAGSQLGRYLSRAGMTPLRFDDYFGAQSRPAWLSDEWHVVFGPHLLRLVATSTSILSEGATGDFFDLDISILNPNPRDSSARIAFLREDGTSVTQTRTLPALSHTTIHVDRISGLEGTAASTVVEALDAAPLAVQRTMSWDARGYAGHAGNAVDRSRPRWLFAEGAQGYFDTFYLLVNDGTRAASVRMRFLRETGTPVDRQFTLAPRSRATVYAGAIPELVNQAFAATVEADQPIVAERAMYFGRTPFWSGGHESPGSPATAYRWFHAEGATGPVLDTFFLIANPNGRAVTAQVVYATGTGQLLGRSYTLAPYSRRTINVEHEDAALANADVSIYVVGDGPIVTERSMYWAIGSGEWQEAHNSAGMTAGATRWAVAGGRAGGPRNHQTYVLVANPYFSTQTAEVRVRFVSEQGGAPVDRTYSVAPGRRLSIRANDIAGFADATFGVIVDSVNGVPIFVEQSTYWDADGVTWAAGTNVVGTRLP